MDFTPVETHWGVMYLHKSREVWYHKHDYHNGKEMDCWIAFHTSRDTRVDDPWCYDAISLGTVFTEGLAIKLCTDRVEKMELVRSGKWVYA